MKINPAIPEIGKLYSTKKQFFVTFYDEEPKVDIFGGTFFLINFKVLFGSAAVVHTTLLIEERVVNVGLTVGKDSFSYFMDIWFGPVEDALDREFHGNSITENWEALRLENFIYGGKT